MSIGGAWRLSSWSVKCLAIAVIAMMSATAFFVASATRSPVAYPDNPTITGSVIVYGNGPVATMEFNPSSDGVWWFFITGSEVKTVDIKVYDLSAPLPDMVYAKIIHMDSKTTFKNSTLIQVTGNHTYVLNAQAGRQPGSAQVTGCFKSLMNAKPVAIISGPDVAMVDEMVHFSGTNSYDPDGIIVVWLWLFGDGIAAEGPTVTHAYSAAGYYLVSLLITDNDNASSVATKMIRILQPSPTEGNWSQPLQLGVESNQSSSGLDVAMNSKGQAVVAWNAYQEPSWQVWTRRYSPDFGWQAPESVGECNIGNQPAVGIDDAGNVSVVWIKDNVIFTRRNVIAYGAWDDPVAMTNGTGHPITYSLAVNPDGKAVLAWLEQTGSRYDVFGAVRFVGNWWSSPVLIENSVDTADNPSAAIDDSGTAIVVFNIYVVQPIPRWDVWANTYEPGQGWKGAVMIENLAYFSSLPQVSMDASGGFATWCYATTTGSNQDNTVYAARFVSGAWTPAARLDPGTSPSLTYPRVSAWGPANATFLWIVQDDIKGLPGELRASRYMSGVGWTDPEALNTGARLWNPRIAVDESGKAFVGWFQHNESASQYAVMVAMYSPQGGWSGVQDLGTVTIPKALDIAAGPENNALVAWTDYSPGTLWASHRSPSIASSPIAEAGPTQYLWGEMTVTFDGSGSYSDIGSYVWTWIAGNGSRKSASGLVVTIPSEWFFAYGNYTVMLTAMNADGRTATDTVAIAWGFRIMNDTPRGVETVLQPMPGYFRLRIENAGMTSFHWRILDFNRTGPPFEVFNETVTFSSPDQLLITDAFWMVGGGWYQSEYVPTGPSGSSMTIYSYYVPA